MPTYDYECPECGHREEILKKHSNTDINEVCPECGKFMQRLLSAPAFHLKGTGWYVTDYKKNKKPDKKPIKELING